MVLDDDSIQDQLEGSWTGPACDVNNPQSMSEVVGHTFGSPANTYEDFLTGEMIIICISQVII